MSGRLVIGCLTLLLVAACALPWSEPAAPPHRLVYVTPDRAVAVIAATGGQPTLLSPARATPTASGQEGRVYTWPVWSPDGRRVAFLAIDAVYTGAVMVAQADGSARTIIHELYGHPIYLSWSPTGAQLATLVSGEDALDLLLADADRPNRARRIANGQPLYSSWAPDGRSLLIHSGGSFLRNGVGGLRIVSTTVGVDPEPINIDPNDFQAPAWSPTGAFQVFAGDNGTGSEAVFLRGSDGSLRRFAETVGQPAMLWSPRGDRLAWSTVVDFPYYYQGLQVASIDGRLRQRLTDEALVAFFWSPDGTRLAYFALNTTNDRLELRVIPVTGGSATTVARFHPTRELIQFISYFDQYAQSTTIWSADSRLLTFAGWLEATQPEPPPTLYTVPADGSAPPTAIVPARIGFFNPAPPPPAPTPAATPRRR